MIVVIRLEKATANSASQPLSGNGGPGIRARPLLEDLITREDRFEAGEALHLQKDAVSAYRGTYRREAVEAVIVILRERFLLRVGTVKT